MSCTTDLATGVFMDGLRVPTDVTRTLRVRELIVRALRSILRDEVAWMFCPIIGPMETSQQRFAATARSTNMTIEMSQGFRRCLEGIPVHE
jgi:hypothetical protein